jgi:hypothetical protein
MVARNVLLRCPPKHAMIAAKQFTSLCSCYATACLTLGVAQVFTSCANLVTQGLAAAQNAHAIACATAAASPLVQDAIRPLQAAAKASAPSEMCLAPMEADLLECCIRAKCYHIAVRWLESRPIYEVYFIAHIYIYMYCYVLHSYFICSVSASFTVRVHCVCAS